MIVLAGRLIVKMLRERFQIVFLVLFVFGFALAIENPAEDELPPCPQTSLNQTSSEDDDDGKPQLDASCVPPLKEEVEEATEQKEEVEEATEEEESLEPVSLDNSEDDVINSTALPGMSVIHVNLYFTINGRTITI